MSKSDKIPEIQTDKNSLDKFGTKGFGRLKCKKSRSLLVLEARFLVEKFNLLSGLKWVDRVKMITFLHVSSLVAQSHTAIFNILFSTPELFHNGSILHLSRRLFQTVNRLRNATVLDAVISCRSTAFATIADCGRINVISPNVVVYVFSIISTLIPQCRCRLLSPLLIPVKPCNCRVGCRDHLPHSPL